MDPKSLQEERQMHREGHLKTEAEIRVKLPQTKECLVLPEAVRGQESSTPMRLQREHSPDNTLILDF